MNTAYFIFSITYMFIVEGKLAPPWSLSIMTSAEIHLAVKPETM